MARAVEVMWRPRPRSPTRPIVAVTAVVGIGEELGIKMGATIGLGGEEKGKRESRKRKRARIID